MIVFVVPLSAPSLWVVPLLSMYRVYSFHVGASLLAMVENDNAVCLFSCGAFEFFASELAPTVLVC
ncbi:hypothetical protein EJA72_21560 [Pseudomonas sp. PB120]|nr:hypothetical protein [Pseudomonas sp. PB120]